MKKQFIAIFIAVLTLSTFSCRESKEEKIEESIESMKADLQDDIDDIEDDMELESDSVDAEFQATEADSEE